MLCFIYYNAECRYVECRYTKCNYDGCRGALILSLVQSDSYFQPLGVLRHPEKNIFKAYLKK